MTEHEIPADDPWLLQSMRLHDVITPIVDSSPPTEIHERLLTSIRQLGEASVENGNVALLMNVREGLAAARYHRDRIEAIERDIVERVREAFPTETERPSSTASIRVSTIAHEYIAYLNSIRRMLDYLARAVAACFGLEGASIKKLAKMLREHRPGQLAERVAEECDELLDRFDYVLSRDDRKSPRDRAAHREPIEPVWLLIVWFPTGPVGVELQDGGHGALLEPDTSLVLDPARMTRDTPLLAAAIDDQCARLHDFVLELVEIAAEAEIARTTS